ncbi:hypothetical protein MCOR25_005169 [Pyricularia grisea]|nr:hypothetical protein MCOR25_005169 [Pyricularia grisea]
MLPDGLMSLRSDDEESLRPLPQDQTSDSDGTDSSSDEADDVEADSRRFEQIISDLRVGDLRLDEPERLEAFMHNHQSILSKTTSPENKTLLHYLAEKDISMVSVRGMKSLVLRLVQLEADLLAQKDCDDKTPLMRAISLRNHELAEAMVKAHGEVDRILRITYKLGGNCLHEAIRNKSAPRSRSKPAALDDDLVDLLVSRASSETLCAQDQYGLSPLHLAVDYSRCDKSQPRIVRSLVERCPAALDLRDNKQLSPYRYLEETKKAAMEKARKKLLKEEKRSEYGSSGSVKKTGSVNHRGGRGSLRDRPHGKFEDGTGGLQPLRDLIIQAEAPPTGKYGTDSIISRVASKSSMAPPGNKVLETSANMKVTRQGRRNKLSKVKPDEASVVGIKNFLKLHYMRTKGHSEVVTFLYGNRDARQINFDLSEDALVVRMNDFKDLKFEDVLQYVEVARLKVEGKTSAKDATGRTDLEELFGWLKKQGVGRILTVIVDDLHSPAHSDEAIETCLEGLGIETWDWRKKDICSEVIKVVAPDVRVVHLYWGGNNAILRSWSSVEGLRSLPALEKVYISLEQGLETNTRMRVNFEAFKKRIQGNNSQIMVFEKKTPTSGVTDIHVDDHGRDRRGEHQWLRVMENFSLFLRNAVDNANLNGIKDTTGGFSMKHDIKVALIDDGVDIGDPRISECFAEGYSYDERDGDGADRVHPFYRSSGGHGTAMASLICKICPKVRLWVFRLRERIVDGNRQLTAKSAAEAVRRAIDNSVDVISMSWTIEKTESNKSDVGELERAIEDAAKSDILMFCSASDQGMRRDNTYPYRCPTKKIFRIGAAKATGAADEYVGDPNAVDFLFPGHKVVEEDSGDSNEAKQRRALPRDLTGSSAATALASGLAALILYCVQVGCVLKAPGNNPEEADYANFEALKSHERMKTALERIGTTKESNNKFIEVWNRFEKIVKKAEGEPQDFRIGFIEELADDLMRTD